MSETITNATPAQTAAPKAAKAKKPAKATKAKAEINKLSKPCRLVLKTLAKSSGGLSRRIVAERVEKTGGSVFNGRISNETKTYSGLVKAKLVTETELGNGKDVPTETVYSITAAGRKAYDASK